jgi:branched-chain amino acid transport system permease protein
MIEKIFNVYSSIQKEIKSFVKRHKTMTHLALLAILLVIPVFVKNSGTLGILCRILMFSILASSLNSINGYSGQTCIGHAGFYCIGAYTEAILATKFGISFWLLLPVAGIITAAASLLIALPTMRMRGIYLSIVTLGFSEIVRLIALNWESVTGGPMGIKNIPIPMFFGFEVKGPRHFYYIYLGILILFLFCTNRVIKSRVGRSWISIREDQLAARSLGVETTFYKSINFMYGAFWAGIAGAIYAPYARYIDSASFGLDTGWNIFSMVVIGGQGTLVGPIVGSSIINILTEILRPIGNWRMVAYAVLVILMMWLRPQGLAGASDSILAGNRRLEARSKMPVGKKEVCS